MKSSLRGSRTSTLTSQTEYRKHSYDGLPRLRRGQHYLRDAPGTNGETLLRITATQHGKTDRTSPRGYDDWPAYMDWSQTGRVFFTSDKLGDNEHSLPMETFAEEYRNDNITRVYAYLCGYGLIHTDNGIAIYSD